LSRQEWRWAMLASLVLVSASSLPYLVAWAVTPEGAHSTGLIFNPQDGNSYIAKMRQGLRGSWLFHLAFTPERSCGAYLFLFHLLLGHLARWTGLSLIVVYHAARVLGGTAMLLTLYALASCLRGDVGERRAMFLFSALGSGLGWLAALFGVMTGDLWVQEAFPAYALLANAHFPSAIALMGGAAIGALRIAGGGRPRWPWGLGMAVAAVALGVVQPFGLVALFGGLGVMLVAQLIRERVIPWPVVGWVVAAGAAALPYPLYMQWALRSDPILAAWNAQNETPSLPLWDWALSYGLVLVLAVLGMVLAVRRSHSGDWLLLGWVAVTLVGMYLPLPLQRRLSLGLGVPLGLLAGAGWWRVLRPCIKVRRRGLLQGLLVAFCALTPIFLTVGTLLQVQAGNPWFYLSAGEWAVLQWLRSEGRPDAVVLCAPQMGLFVPAWAGQPVVYGHPFETVSAEQRMVQVEAYWAGEMSAAEQEAFLRENRVGYVLVGPRESEIGDWALEIKGLKGALVFEAQDVAVYEVR
jgi:hypothetical protein